MNLRIKCENCIYYTDNPFNHKDISSLKGRKFCLMTFQIKFDHVFEDEFCGHFVDKETNKSFRDLYFENKGVAVDIEIPPVEHYDLRCQCHIPWMGTAAEHMTGNPNCPIHGRGEE